MLAHSTICMLKFSQRELGGFRSREAWAITLKF
jgi:hypothetical protein